MSLFENKKFIKKENRTIILQRSSGKNNQKKFQQLYESYKTQKTKEEKYRQKILSEREKNELAECSFSPKIIKNNNVFKRKPYKAITDEERINNKLKVKKLLKSNTNTEILINRQNKWLENKNNKLKRKIVAEAIKTVEGCVFKPEIKKLNNKMISNLKIESKKIVEQPNSYLNYINRNKKFRENKNKNKINEYPISKNSKSPYRYKILKKNNYDYTKHRLTDTNYLLTNNSNSNYKEKTSTSTNKSFKCKEKIKAKINKSIPISKLKITNMSNDELYSLIYLNEKEKIETNISDYTQEIIQKLFGEKKQIYFKQTMEGLHKALINLNLYEDEDDDLITIS